MVLPERNAEKALEKTEAMRSIDPGPVLEKLTQFLADVGLLLGRRRHPFLGGNKSDQNQHH